MAKKRRGSRAKNGASGTPKLNASILRDTATTTKFGFVVVDLEIIDFDSLLFDSNDLSTIRGGGLLALKVLNVLVAELNCKAVGLPGEPTFLASRLGGSTATLVFHTLDRPAVADLAKELQTVIETFMSQKRATTIFDDFDDPIDLSALQFSFGIANSDDLTEAEDGPLYRFCINASQLAAQNSLPPPIKNPKQTAQLFLTQLARARAALARYSKRSVYLDAEHDFGPSDQVTSCRVSRNRICKSDKSQPDYRLLNAFTAIRQKIGRTQRNTMYLEQLSTLEDDDAIVGMQQAPFQTVGELRAWLKGPIRFAQGFDEIALPDASVDVRENVKGKLGLIYADGNSFSAPFIAASGDSEKCANISVELKKHQARMLASILAWAASASHMSFQAGKNTVIRLETLLWGGDEYMFAVPAWHAMDLMAVFRDATEGWKVGSKTDEVVLSHASALLIAPYKVPIRLLRDAVKELGDAVKDSPNGRKQHGFQVFVAEGLDMFSGNILIKRRQLFGVDRRGGEAKLSDDLFQLLPNRDAEIIQRGAELGMTEFHVWRQETARMLNRTGASHLHRLYEQVFEKVDGKELGAEIERVTDGAANLDILSNYLSNTLALYPRENGRSVMPLLTAMMVKDYIDPLNQLTFKDAGGVAA